MDWNLKRENGYQDELWRRRDKLPKLVADPAKAKLFKRAPWLSVKQLNAALKELGCSRAEAREFKQERRRVKMCVNSSRYRDRINAQLNGGALRVSELKSEVEKNRARIAELESQSSELLHINEMLMAQLESFFQYSAIM